MDVQKDGLIDVRMHACICSCMFAFLSLMYCELSFEIAARLPAYAYVCAKVASVRRYIVFVGMRV